MVRTIFLIFLLLGLPAWLVGRQQQAGCPSTLARITSAMEEEAWEKVEELYAEFEKNKPALHGSCAAEYAYIKGQLAWQNGIYETARTALSDAYQRFDQLQDQHGLIRAGYQLGLFYLEEGETEEATRYLDRSIRLGAALPQHRLLPDVYDLRAMLYSSEGRHAAAMQLLKQAAAMVGQGRDLRKQSYLLNQIATNYQSLGEIDSAIFYYRQLIEAKQHSEDRSGLLSDYSTLGKLYFELGHFRDAQQTLIMAITQAEALQDTLSQLTIFIDIANVYLAERLYEPAKTYADRARHLAGKYNMLLAEGQSLEIKATALAAAGERDSALVDYRAALAIFEQLDFKRQVAAILIRMAAIDAGEEHLLAAEESLQAALRISLEEGDKLGELETKLALAGVWLDLGREKSQLSAWLDDCMLIAAATNNKSGLQKVHQLQSRYHERQGDYQLALQHYRAFKSIQDSLLNRENALIVRELEERYQTEKKDREIAQQQIALEQQQNIIRRRSLHNWLLLAGICILIALVALVLFINQRNKQLNRQRLSVLEKERETQVLRAMVSGEEQERLRIARDLHDGLGAVFATTKMMVSAMGDQLPALKDIPVYHKAGEMIDDACSSIREISHNMMPGSLDKHGLETALADMCAAVEQAHPLNVDFIPYGLENLNDDIIETNVYRIVQELLHNAVKHAAAKEIIVQLTLEDGRLNIVVEDDGRGFDTTVKSQTAGIGIDSVRTRVLYLQGRWELYSNPGEGCTYTIDIPIKSK